MKISDYFSFDLLTTARGQYQFTVELFSPNLIFRYVSSYISKHEAQINNQKRGQETNLPRDRAGLFSAQSLVKPEKANDGRNVVVGETGANLVRGPGIDRLRRNPTHRTKTPREKETLQRGGNVTETKLVKWQVKSSQVTSQVESSQVS